MDNGRAVKSFIDANKLKRMREYKCDVDMWINGKYSHDGCSIYVTYVEGQNRFEVSIEWLFSDSTMRSIGLRGIYNTDFQKFQISDNDLIIIDDEKNVKLQLSVTEEA